MEVLFSQSLAVFLITLAVTALAAFLGSLIVSTRVAVQVGDLTQFSVIETATLTLLGLVIGFTFAMAVSRYDQRKNLEEEEANAIGTEYVRVTLLPEANAARARAALKRYVAQRIAWYTTIDAAQLRDIDAATARTQDELWEAVRGPVFAQQNSVMALVAAGMNAVINSQGYSQAAFWNRIPQAGWLLLLVLSFCANVLVGMGAQAKGHRALIYVLPVIISLAFVLIADIDSPRRGLIAVGPRNLLALAQSLGLP